MNLKYISDETITVSAGKLDIYKIAFKDENQVSNFIYIRKVFSRRIVKNEVIGQPLIMELTEL